MEDQRHEESKKKLTEVIATTFIVLFFVFIFVKFVYL